MLLSQLHDMIKHNYEHGLYSQDYTSKSNNSNPSKIKDLKNLSDFQMGKHQAYEDYQISKKFRFYPKLPFVLLNLISGNRMQEVISFINGYNHEKHRLKNK
ncbi:hypothetical protein BFD03_07890 [Limosilactobacillus reuteri]|nr:hypothetical protein BFD03_07890 [Limosilactobacillus reuteri]